MRHLLLSLSLSLALGTFLHGQDLVHLETFKDTRVINTHSTETLNKRRLDVRIGHRFGDIAGDRGGFSTFYGLESAADVLFAFEYGLTDQLMIGVSRAKGGGRLPNGTRGLDQLLSLTAKYRVLTQSEETGNPLSVAVLGVGTMSAAERIEGADVLQNFEKFAHRFAYHGQLIAARKFSDIFSLQTSLGITYRNLVPFGDDNIIYSVGAASRIQLTKVFGLILDATFPFSEYRANTEGFAPILGLGLEIDTGGHVFQVNLTNATQIMETDYIPYSSSQWANGEFRLGFTISRLFNL
jgi:hypothetical protein